MRNETRPRRARPRRKKLITRVAQTIAGATVIIPLVVDFIRAFRK